jgi:FkbM family methyltransferase
MFLNYFRQLYNQISKLRRQFIRKRDIKNIYLRFLKLFIIPEDLLLPQFKYYGILKVKTKEGSFRMNSTGGALENEIFWKGIYRSMEPETIWIIEKLSINADCIFDIGANTGLYSLFVKTINPLCTVHSFEPAKNTYAEFRENILLNQYKIFANNKAVSNRNGFATFYDTFETHQYSASLSPLMLKENPSYHYKINEYQVEVITLDHYISKNDINNIDLIKIDVELHEPEVFEGMLDTLSRFRPFVLFEVLSDEIGTKLKQLLVNSEYQLFYFAKIRKDFYLVRVEDLTGHSDKDWNYFACHKERLMELQEMQVRISQNLKTS